MGEAGTFFSGLTSLIYPPNHLVLEPDKDSHRSDVMNHATGYDSHDAPVAGMSSGVWVWEGSG